MVIPKLPSYQKVETEWLEKGGISPQRVVDSLGNSIMFDAFRIYPQFVEESRKTLEVAYEIAEFFAFDLALMYLDRWGRVGTIEPVIRFSDVCSGIFNDWVQFHYDFMLAIGEEPNGTPLQEVRWLGEQFAERLVANGFTKGGVFYELEEKGRQYVKAVKEKNRDLMRQLYNNNWQPLNKILDNRNHNR